MFYIFGISIAVQKKLQQSQTDNQQFLWERNQLQVWSVFSRKHVIPWNLSAAGQLAQSAFVSCRMQKPIFNKHRHYEKSCTADIYRTANAVKMKHESLGVKLGCFRGTRSFLLYMIICTQHVHSIHECIYNTHWLWYSDAWGPSPSYSDILSTVNKCNI